MEDLTDDVRTVAVAATRNWAYTIQLGKVVYIRCRHCFETVYEDQHMDDIDHHPMCALLAARRLLGEE